jgi:hypothetical protein
MFRQVAESALPCIHGLAVQDGGQRSCRADASLSLELPSPNHLKFSPFSAYLSACCIGEPRQISTHAFCVDFHLAITPYFYFFPNPLTPTAPSLNIGGTV